MRRPGAGRGGGGGGGGGAVRRRSATDAVFAFVRVAEFEILLFLCFVIAFLLFKDLTSRPEYNQIFVKKPDDFWS